MRKSFFPYRTHCGTLNNFSHACRTWADDGTHPPWPKVCNIYALQCALLFTYLYRMSVIFFKKKTFTKFKYQNVASLQQMKRVKMFDIEALATFYKPFQVVISKLSQIGMCYFSYMYNSFTLE